LANRFAVLPFSVIIIHPLYGFVKPFFNLPFNFDLLCCGFGSYHFADNFLHKSTVAAHLAHGRLLLKQ
jgi:hypothetical protein